MPLLKIDRRQHRWLLISQLLIAVIMGVLLAASNYQTTQESARGGEQRVRLRDKGRRRRFNVWNCSACHLDPETRSL
jgi:hypothetical protein